MRLLLGLVAMLPAAAQAQDVARTNVRYDEDWSVLREAPQTGWRQAKYLPLDADGTVYLTLGGEARVRYEGFDNNLWGDPLASDDGYLWLRTMPSVDLHAGPFRAFVQTIAAEARGVGAGEGPADATGVDMLQGFADVQLSLGNQTRLTLRGGRALVGLGSERLVGTRYGPNVPQAFDGVQAIAELGPHRIVAFSVRPVDIGGRDFDDETSRTRRLHGVYATVAVAHDIGLDAYWLGFANDRAVFGGTTDEERRDTFGVRVFGQRGRLSWNWEAIVQRGRFEGQSIRAWSVATETGWSLAEMRFTPRIRLRANIASGDRDPGDDRLGTFNALFPKGRYFGELSPVGPRNIANVNPALDLELGSGVTIEIAAASFWRASRSDGVYDIPGQLLRPAGTSRARHIGDQIEVLAEWQASDLLGFSVSLSAFRPGAFIRQTGPGRTIGMIALEAAFKL